jgi:hypothetical protein
MARFRPFIGTLILLPFVVGAFIFLTPASAAETRKPVKAEHEFAPKTRVTYPGPTTSTTVTLPPRPLAKEATVTQAPLPPGTKYKCHGRPAPDDPKAFIYFCESGNRPEAVNAGGCRGLGQACPGSKLPCSNTDYDCQDKWFTAYMLDRYKTWEHARQVWLTQEWW